VSTSRPLRVVQVSDSHLAPGVPSADDNWTAVVEHLAADPPDLVVHTGDVTVDGFGDDAHLGHARARLDELPCPWRAIPGNHDVGDIPPTSMAVTAARVAAFEERFGPGSWTIDLDPHDRAPIGRTAVDAAGAWRIVGIDVQSLLGLAGDDRWVWLEEALSTDGPKMLCIHRPLWPAPTDGENPDRYLPEPARSRLAALARAGDVRIVASGHVHQRASLRHDGLRAEWAPATWAMIPEPVQPTIAQKVVGWVEHELGDTAISRTVVPSSLAQLTIGEDFPSPYDH
jgi:Icc protein